MASMSLASASLAGTFSESITNKQKKIEKN